MRQIIFDKISHVEISTRTENDYIKLVKAGETYEPSYFSNSVFPYEDVVKKGRWWSDYAYKCLAKKDLWYSGDSHWYVDIEGVMEDWNNSVIYDHSTGKWYNRPWLEIHLLDGSKLKTYFDTDEELEKEVNNIFKGGVNQVEV